MNWRVGSAFLLVGLLAGCSDMPGFQKMQAFDGFKGWNDFAMATPEPVRSQGLPVADPSFRMSELRAGMDKAQLEAMYPGRLAFDSGDARNQLYFVEPTGVTPYSAVARDRLALWLNDGRLATFGLVNTNEPVAVVAAPAMLATSPALPPSAGAPPRGKYAVQVGAPHSEAEARAVIDGMRAKYPSLLGREWATINRVSLPQGVFYRVVIGPLGSAQQASQLCSSLKAQGAECFIRGT
jgi:hypothetical protein